MISEQLPFFRIRNVFIFLLENVYKLAVDFDKLWNGDYRALWENFRLKNVKILKDYT